VQSGRQQRPGRNSPEAFDDALTGAREAADGDEIDVRLVDTIPGT
jgi:hypothetical protein